jgi:phosphoglycolate phosphatase-like HAD superfamily hydrolase
MTLVLFDVDGTLTATNAVDAACFAAAFKRVFEFPIPTTDWSFYRHCTDTGIIDEALENQVGRPALQKEFDAFEKAFVEELDSEYSKAPRGFMEVNGAKAILDALTAHPDMEPALASGGMRRSATYKLGCIGVDAREYPGAFANDSRTRGGIAQCAIGRCKGVRDADIVYVGDGPWDFRTSAELGMRFIGISGDGGGARLRALGKCTILEHYVDQEAFFSAVRTAKVPTLRGEE